MSCPSCPVKVVSVGLLPSPMADYSPIRQNFPIALIEFFSNWLLRSDLVESVLLGGFPLVILKLAQGWFCYAKLLKRLLVWR